MYVIKVISTNGKVLGYLSASGKISPLVAAFHYTKKHIAEIVVRLHQPVHEDVTLEIAEIKLQ